MTNEAESSIILILNESVIVSVITHYPSGFL